METTPAEKIARNNSAFREANERIASAAVGHGLAERGPLPFLCECSDPRCTTIIHLTLDEYRRVRSNPRWFAHAAAHEVAVAGAVAPVEEHDRYTLVEKIGQAGVAAVRLDPNPGSRA
jgi:hypothetical protein